MSMIDDGGAAFPRVGEGFGDPRYDAPGMTLRDQFAGQALTKLIGAVPLAGIDGYFGTAREGSPMHKRAVAQQRAEIARRSYQYADAMLAARKEPTNV